MSPIARSGVILVGTRDMTDQALWEEFLARRDENAFAELVRRHIGLVYAAARRQMRDAVAADDVTQSVFILLSQKAHTIRCAGSIPGWLLMTTRGVALNTLRAQSRRQRHESEAAVMKQEGQSMHEPAWEEIGPLLDEAVATLGTDQRNALTLRYFRNQPLAEVALALGISEAAARKRVQRAVVRLRKFFAARGIVASAQALPAMLTVHVLAPNPAPTLCAHVTRAALSTTPTLAGGSAAGFVKGAILLMTTTKTSVLMTCALAVLVIGLSGGAVFLAARRSSVGRPDPALVAAADTQPAPDWRGQFNLAYALQGDAVVRHIAAPFPQLRGEYCRAEMLSNENQPPDMMVFEADGPSLRRLGILYGSQTVASVLATVAEIRPAETDLPRQLLDKPVSGDWVVRRGATRVQRIEAVCDELAPLLGSGMTLRTSQVQRETIVVSGTFTPPPAADSVHLQTAPPIRITQDLARPPDGGKQLRGKATEILHSIGDYVNMPVELIITNAEQVADWSIEPSADLRRWKSPPDPAAVDEILANIAAQTSLEIHRELKPVPVWRLERK